MIFLSLLSLSGEGTCHTSASDRQLKMIFSEKKGTLAFLPLALAFRPTAWVYLPFLCSGGFQVAFQLRF